MGILSKFPTFSRCHIPQHAHDSTVPAGSLSYKYPRAIASSLLSMAAGACLMCSWASSSASFHSAGEASTPPYITAKRGHIPNKSTARCSWWTITEVHMEVTDDVLPGCTQERRRDSGKWGAAPFSNREKLLLGTFFFCVFLFSVLSLDERSVITEVFKQSPPRCRRNENLRRSP